MLDRCLRNRDYVHQCLRWLLMGSLAVALVACGSKTVQSPDLKPPVKPTEEKQDTLKQTIGQAVPELQNPRLDDWAKVNLLRRWAYRHIDVASSTCVKKHGMAPDVADRGATVIFADFAADKAGVWCAGAADSLLRLYQAYGYTAYSIHFGDHQSLTHTATLVQIQHQGKPMLVMQDAYLNTTYTNSQGGPLDYWDMLRFLQQRQDQKVQIVQQLGDPRDVYYCGKTEVPGKYYDKTAKDLLPVTRLEPGRTKFTYGLTLTAFEQHHELMPKTKQFLVSRGYPPNVKYLWMFPYHASDGNNQQPQLVQTAQAIIQGAAVSQIGR